MKLAKFNELCTRYWVARGDVTELHLREESFDELYEDILSNRAGPVSIVHPHWYLLNPVTKTEVKIRVIETNCDFAMVCYGGVKKRDDIPDS